MSTFSGKIQEIQQISVDRFDGENVESEAYFLSHCHSDHMVGLDSYSFQGQLVENCKNLYASQISCVILRKMIPYIAHNLIELHLYSPTTIQLKNCTFSVTPVPAGHCPGSVMFLFESGKRILYTGDYRINRHDIAKFKSFYDSTGDIKIIDKIYLDTTFFLKRFWSFPKREESLKEVCAIIEEWVQRGKNFLVKLHTSATYGYEYLFNEVFKKLNMPIHVNQKTHKLYSLIPEMDKSVTLDGSRTQIHCNCGIRYQHMCDFRLDSFVKTIRISALTWTQDDLKEGPSNFDSDSGIHYVCYSTHASYEEGVELLRHLKPKEIEACVEQKDPYANKEMTMLITGLLEELKPKVEIKEVVPKLFPVKSETSKKHIDVEQSSEDFSILNSPPRDTFYLNSIVDSNEKGKVNCERDSSNIIDGIISPVRKVKISSVQVSEDNIRKDINSKSEVVESTNVCDSKQNIINPSIDSFNTIVSKETEGPEEENSVLLTILDLQSDHTKSPQSNVDISENIQENLRTMILQNSLVSSELVEETAQTNIAEEWEDSILMSIIDTPPEMKEVDELKGDEEDSVILSLIDSPPSKRKK